MKLKTEREIREWWNACPTKLRKVITILKVLLAFYFVYEIGYGVGKFIYYILH